VSCTGLGPAPPPGPVPPNERATLRAVAPSGELRRWYGHEVGKFAEFRDRYLAELGTPERAEALAHLRELADPGPLTLLTATKDVEHSQAAVLAERLGRAR
jgi:uncharacterized protein YeaO (DUF488 family)